MSTLKGIPAKRITSFLDSERNWNWLTSHSLEVDGDTITIGSGVITSDNIVDRTIQAIDIQTSTITATEIGANTIRADNILADTLTANEIAADAITTSELAANSVTSAKIVANTITAADIQAGTITATEIASATITGGNIAGATITGSNVASATITASNITVANLSALSANLGTITAGTVTGATLQTASSGARMIMNTSGLTGYATDGTTKVLEFKTSDGSLAITGAISSGSTIPASTITGTLTGSQIGSSTIGSSHIVDASILTGDIAALTITASNIAANTITAGKIAADTITASEIAANAIDTSELNANAVTSAKIAANTIVAADISAGTITTTEIAATTIVAGNIAASTITGSQIAGTTITAANIAASTITGAKIAATTIDTANLVATAIDAMTITGATFRTSSGSSRVQMDSTGVFYTSDGGTTKDTHLSTSGLKLLAATSSTAVNERQVRWLDTSANNISNFEIWNDASTNAVINIKANKDRAKTRGYINLQAYGSTASTDATLELSRGTGSGNALKIAFDGSLVKTIFAVDGTSDYLMLAGAQTITGAKTFSSKITIDSVPTGVRINGSTHAAIELNSAAASVPYVEYYRGGTFKWQMGVDNGSPAGTDGFYFYTTGYAAALTTGGALWLAGNLQKFASSSKFVFRSGVTTNPLFEFDNSSAATKSAISDTGVYSVSDKRLKKNIKRKEKPLSDLQKLIGIEFNSVDTESSSIGVIAQEVQQVYPSLVMELENGRGKGKPGLAVNYAGLVAVLLEGVKELDDRIKELENV